MNARRGWIVLGVLTLTGAAVVQIVRMREAARVPMANMPGMADMPGMAAGSDGSVLITPDQLRQFGVTFATVEQQTLTADTKATGIVVVDETRLVQVAPRFSGYVERLYVEANGDRVRVGQRLADIFSPEILAAEEELLLARRLAGALGVRGPDGLDSTTTDLTSGARRRLRILGVTDGDIDSVLASGRARRSVPLLSPASGTVVEKQVLQGQAVRMGDALYTLADLDRVWIDAELRERDVAAVRAGSTAEVTLTAAGRVLRGTVLALLPSMDMATRTVRARIAVDNRAGQLRPGMYAAVRFSTPSRRVVMVPASAVVRTGDAAIVFVDLGGGRLSPQDIEIGGASGEVVEVLAGLEPGQRVVTSAQYLLESESNLADVMRAMMGQMGSGAMAPMPGMSGMDGMKDMPGMAPSGRK